MITFIKIFVVLWCGFAAYSYWSYNNIFPSSNIKISDGKEVVISFFNLPLDTYSISFLVRHNHGRSTKEERSELMNIREDYLSANQNSPLDVKVKLTGLFSKEIISYEGNTGDWTLGDRHDFSAEVRFDEYFQLYTWKANRLEFTGYPLEPYQLTIAVKNFNKMHLQYPMTVFVSGRRDDGYFVLLRIVVLGASLAFFLVFGLFVVIVKWMLKKKS